MAEIVLVAAVCENGVIGRGLALPFRLPSDLKRFKAMTLGKPVLMGRTTFESIGRPLPRRPNIVVSRDPTFRPEGADVIPDLAMALARARLLGEANGAGSVMVIGGGEIYAQTIDAADRLEITRVHASPPGDVFFPQIDPVRFARVSEIFTKAGEGDEYDMTFETYQRKV